MSKLTVYLGAGPRRAVVGGGGAVLAGAADHGRHAAGGADGVLAVSPARRRGTRVREVPATMWVPMLVLAVAVRGARASCRSRRTRCWTSAAAVAGDGGEVTMAMLEKACQKAFAEGAVGATTRTPGPATAATSRCINVLTPYYDAERFGIKLVGLAAPRRRAAGVRAGHPPGGAGAQAASRRDAQPEARVRDRLVRDRRRVRGSTPTTCSAAPTR